MEIAEQVAPHTLELVQFVAWLTIWVMASVVVAVDIARRQK